MALDDILYSKFRTATRTLRATFNAYWRNPGIYPAMLDEIRLREENRLLSRSPLTAAIADLTAIRAEVVKLVTDATAIRAEVVKELVDIAAVKARLNMVRTAPAIADATANGKFKTTTTTAYSINGTVYAKAATDPLWDLSAQAATDGTHYRAVWLYLDSGGTGSIAAGADAVSGAAAIAALPAQDTTKAVIGVFVAGVNTNFANALSAQGTLYSGFAADYTLTAVAPSGMTAVAPAGMTAVAPAALTTTASNGIGNGTTNGRLRTNADIDFTVAGQQYRKASTDNLWNLSAETTLSAGQYKAYWLYLDSSGTASIAAGSVQTSAALAYGALPAITSTKSVIGVYIAGPSTNFANALAAQGEIRDGLGGAAF